MERKEGRNRGRERERERVDESKVMTTEQGTVVDLDMVTKEKVMAKRKINKGEDGLYYYCTADCIHNSSSSSTCVPQNSRREGSGKA